MNTETEISIRGTVVYWTLGNKTDADYLKQEFEKIGMAGLAPDKNTDKSSLKIALLSVCANRRRLVRPLVGERGYAIVTESKDVVGKSLDHNVDFDVLLPDSSSTPIFRDSQTGAIFNPAEENSILHRYQIEQDRCASHKLGISITRVIDQLHGTSLRPTGGFYWIPQGALSRWNLAAKAIQESASDGSNIIYSLKTAMDDDMKRAVIDGLSRELSTEIETMETDVMSGDLGKRALKTKQERCERLRSRVKGYKGMFSVALVDLEQSLERVESAVAMSALTNFGV